MLLEITDLHTYYEESHVLQGISLQVDIGEIVALLGRNGVGKSTTLKSIMGIQASRSGEILFKGLNLAGMPTHKIANLGLGYVPEDRRIFPSLTVRENLIMGIKPRQKNTANGWSVDRIYDWFPGLKARDKQKGAYLSGGEQQMLTIGRALMGEPQMLLLDEPTEGLAPIIVQTLKQVILDVHDRGMAILLVEQNMQVVLRLAKRIYVISKGKIVFHGSGDQLREALEIREKYLEV